MTDYTNAIQLKKAQDQLRAYMDDISLTTSLVIGCKWVLRGLEKLMIWARMKFKPGKFRSLVLQKMKIKRTARFAITGEIIPTINEKPVKSLGKWFDCSTNDQSTIKWIESDLDDCLRKINRSGLPDKFKAWIYQHAMLLRILWPLLLNEVANKMVEVIERIISGFLRRWLGLPKSLSSAVLYGTTNAIQLPLNSLKEEFVVIRTREALLYWDSKDAGVSRAGIVIRTGKKWSAFRELHKAEERLQQQGSLSVQRPEGGNRPCIVSESQDRERKRKRKKNNLAKRINSSHGGDSADKDGRTFTSGSLDQTGKLRWSDLWRSDNSHLRFKIQAVCNVLPSPSNLHTWGKSDSPACPLCEGRGSL